MVEIKQLSALEKVRPQDALTAPEQLSRTVFLGERVSYQLVFHCGNMMDEVLEVSIQSPLLPYIRVYQVKRAIMDYPAYPDCTDENYITKEPGIMPDILVPFETGRIHIGRGANVSLWVTIDIPDTLTAAEYEITAEVCNVPVTTGGFTPLQMKKTMSLCVLPVALPKQELRFTQWVYVDCIAEAHGVEVYSEAHWDLIEKYIEAAAYIGINMLLMPVITPPLDTAYRTARKNVQLTDISLIDGKYRFGFDKVKRWIELCKRHGIRYFEISHLFSQWGAAFAPNIFAIVDGREEQIFGWDTPSDDPAYAAFLQSFLPQLVAVLEENDIAEYTYFHISDEPYIEYIDAYRNAKQLIEPLIGRSKTLDALSDFEFFRRGLVSCPIPASDHIEPFLKAEIKNPWVYYCCAQDSKVSNRFLAMPACRNRIMGLQMYYYGIKGFLHWGFNYYNSRCSVYRINPYTTTSGDGSYPSGDAFSVYPGENGPLLSMRALVFYEGIQDIAACRLLESYIGRQAVIELIDKTAGAPLTFENYPNDSEYLLSLREKMTRMIQKFAK